MGFLTTFTISNDALDILEDDPKQVCEKLYHAALAGKVSTISHHYKPKKKKRGIFKKWQPKSFGGGVHCNPIKVQKCRHADNWTVYVHAGNTLVEMNSYSDDTAETMRKNTEFFEEIVKYMQRNVTEMKRQLKEYKKNDSKT